MANRTLRVLFGLVGAASAVFLLWFAYEELTREGGDTWFALVLISMVPALIGMSHTIPAFLFARDPNERTRVVAAPFLSVCSALTMFLLAITAGFYIRGWKGALFGGAVGLIVGVQGIASMRFLRRTVDRPTDASPTTASKPSTRQIVWIVAKLLASLTALLVVFGGFGYLLFGRWGATVFACVWAGFLVLFYAQVFRGFRRSKAARPGP